MWSGKFELSPKFEDKRTVSMPPQAARIEGAPINPNQWLKFNFDRVFDMNT